jgi:hypothetical protein
MPLTLAHPAVILLLPRKRYLPVLPLIAGSLGPDLPYFLPERVTHLVPNSHQLPGAITAAPLAAFVWLASVYLLKAPLTSLLWGRHRTLVSSALQSFGSTAAEWFAAVPAVLLGVLLHLVWDSFTHPYGWPVQHLSILRTSLVPTHSGLELFRVLQWLSSVVGVAAITLLYVRAVHRSGPAAISSVIDFWRRTALQVTVLIATAVGLWRALEPSVGFNSFHGRAYLGTTTAISSFVCLYVVGGVVAAARESRAKS